VSDDGFGLEVALVVVLILLNGFFAGAEIAVISARRAALQPLARAGSRRARALLRLKADPDRFLATVQIGVTLVGTLASAVGGVAAVERLEPLVAALPVPWMREVAEPIAVGAVVFGIAFLSLVVGELVPKSLAVRHADPIALWVAGPIEWMARAARVPVAILTAATSSVLRLFGQSMKAHSPFHTLDDIRAILDEADAQGVLDGNVVKGALQFQDYEARLLMTPRSRIVGIPSGSSLEEALRIASESGYSRFPVYRGDLDTIEGVVYARDLYEAERRGKPRDLSALLQRAFVVPITKNARDLLAEMRRGRRHMALVVDEHGMIEGLVTLEDVLEAIVGDIHDERDEPRAEVRRVAEDVLEVDGSLSVKELNARHELALPEGGHYVTIAGLLLDRLGSLPRGGESIELPPYRLVATAVTGRRVERIRIEKVGAPQPV
jgi:putative hemolysin